MIYNSLAAIAVGSLFGMDTAEISDDVSSYKPFAGRLETKRIGDITVLDDSYNANPASMKSSIDVLQYARGRKVCILGDMFELGERAAEFHAEVGRRAHVLALDQLVTVGALANANIGGDVQCASAEEAKTALAAILKPGDLVLLKASHGMHLELAI